MKSFSSSNLHPGIVEFLSSKGMVIPTSIQARAIPILLEHEGDFVGRSVTGSGKTYAFGAPLLSRIDPSVGRLQAIVLVPTRELCEQVGNELIQLGSKVEKLKIQAIYGGTPLKDQIHEVSNGVQVIVATPGRLMDLIKRKVVDVSKLNYVVFDEADEMLLKGFGTDVDAILAHADRSYCTWLFSATMPDEVHIVIKKYLTKSLKKVIIERDQKTNAQIVHQAIVLTAEEKLNVLLHYVQQFEGQTGIIFCRTKSGVQKLYKQLSAKKISAGAIHGDLPQGLRNKVMEQFKAGSVQILIATDVASRGMDVEKLSYVIQYHVPDTKDSYTHRSGRTSRVGNQGVCLTFVFPEEKEKLWLLEKDLSIRFELLPVPSTKDQLVNKAILWAKKIAKEKPLATKLENAIRDEFKKELNHLSKEELLEKLLANYLREEQG